MKTLRFFIAGLLALAAAGCSSPTTKPLPREKDRGLLVYYYGDTRPVSSEDIQNLPAHLTLHELFTRWGFPGIGERGLGGYDAAFYDFRYEVQTDADGPGATFEQSFDQIEIVSIFLVGGAPNERWQRVWLSEKCVPVQPVTRADVDAIPAGASLSYIASHFPASPPTPVSERVIGITYRTPLAGYCFHFFLVRSEDPGEEPKLASVFLSDGSRHTLKWGDPIDLKTGERFIRKSSDPFAAEPTPSRFLQ